MDTPSAENILFYCASFFLIGLVVGIIKRMFSPSH